MTILLIAKIMPLRVMLLGLVLLDLPGSDGIHGDLLVSTVHGERSDETVNRSLAGRVHRVLVMTLVGRGQDNTSFLAEMAEGLVGEEILAAGVHMEGRVEFLP
jgi:hypothetical protein